MMYPFQGGGSSRKATRFSVVSLFVVAIVVVVIFGTCIPSCTGQDSDLTTDLSTTTAAAATTTESQPQPQPQCMVPLKVTDDYIDNAGLLIANASTTDVSVDKQKKTVYTVGVLTNRAIAGDAFAALDITFSSYLTQAVGRQFDPPLAFEMVPLLRSSLSSDDGEEEDADGKEVQDATESRNSDTDVIDLIETGKFDFAYMNPSIFSCVESETIGTTSLVSQIFRINNDVDLTVHNESYEIYEQGGVIFTSIENDEINTMTDLRNKRIGATAIWGLASAQMQFRHMRRYGLSYLQDPSQLIFMNDYNTIVNAVLEGQIDVGFVKAGTLERSVDNRTGTLLDQSLVKVIDPREAGYRTSDGRKFPYTTTTQLYPEWNVAAMNHVSKVVSQAVQTALLQISEHAAIAPHLIECFRERDCISVTTGDAMDATTISPECKAECFASLDPTVFERCDTDVDLALLAADALSKGQYAGWRPSLSYMELRNLQEETGVIYTSEQNGGQGARCVRSKELFDAIVCPSGYYKKTQQGILSSCVAAALDCYGYECLCKPCVKAFGLDFYIFAVVLPVIVLVALILWFYSDAKNKQADALWRIEPEELVFEEPPRILGRGTFGLVLLGEYRGTRVAVKRVLPAKKEGGGSTQGGSKSGTSLGMGGIRGSTMLDESSRPGSAMGSGKRSVLDSSGHSRQSDTDIDLEAARTSPGGGQRKAKPMLSILDMGSAHSGKLSLFDLRLPGAKGAQASTSDGGSESAGGSNSGSGSGMASGVKVGLLSGGGSISNTIYESASSLIKVFKSPFQTQYSKLQKEFMREMRLLSKLRHPCITTVMGAVISKRTEPMLVMEYMELGSLYDLLHNECIIIEGEMVLNILRDIAQGLRFLHSATPQVIHGDLKAQNVLVDSKLRAKVADFGLSQKKKFRKNATGTPYWMAPELLRRESTNTPASDMYAFGILLYEVFSRKDPYEDEENYRDVLKQIIDPKINKRPPVPHNCPPESAAMMKACLLRDPSKRPSSEAVDVKLKHLDIAGVESAALKPLRKSAERERTDDLLSQLFPAHVAQSLREGKKTEPESFDCVTIFFSDIVGYTDIAGSLTPGKCSDLLDRLYTKFDKCCEMHDIFKVETIGDAYMAVTNLAKKQPDHAIIMARFAFDVIEAATTTLIDVDEPERGYLQIRVGLHSGPVVAHVVGSRTPRYSIIGDTVNVASRMESNSIKGRIHVSKKTAHLLQKQHGITLVRRGTVEIKGKGRMETFWVTEDMKVSLRRQAPLSTDDMYAMPSLPTPETEDHPNTDAMGHYTLIERNAGVLERALCRVLSYRNAYSAAGINAPENPIDSSFPSSNVAGHCPLDELNSVISVPGFNACTASVMLVKSEENLPAEVQQQLRNYVTRIAFMYRDHPFHNFEHATQITNSLDTFLQLLLTPTDEDRENASDGCDDMAVNLARTIHKRTFGVASDALMMFSMLFSSLIIYVDHPGMSDAELVASNSPTAAAYRNRAVAQQNALDLAWKVLLEDDFHDLCAAIAPDHGEMLRFRQLVVNATIATDLSDKDMQSTRENRWNEAFAESASLGVDRTATSVFEHLMQAASVAHVMQDWDTYLKYSGLLFEEAYSAWISAGMPKDKDPSINWSRGETSSFDIYVLPLAVKLDRCGAFGSSSFNVYMTHVLNNLERWGAEGDAIVERMCKDVKDKFNSAGANARVQL